MTAPTHLIVDLMPLNPDQQRELSRFPAALQALVECELAAGNGIAEIGHSFPAPPVGAYVLLTQKVTTRPRQTGSGLEFRARQSSSHSGEFTDAARVFFVLEPPDPPPPESDMDEIRRSANPPTTPLEELAQTRPTGAPWMASPSDSIAAPSSESPEVDPLDQGATIDLPSGARRVMHFHDRRPPDAVCAHLEREFGVVFASGMERGQLTFLAHARVNGARFVFELRFEAAHLVSHAYSLRIESSWAEHSPGHHAHFRSTFNSWVGLWTRDLEPTQPPEPPHDAARYQRACAAALDAEKRLNSVEAIQQIILGALRGGASFSTSHKEGGSRIALENGCWVRTDFGDYPGRLEYATDAKFLVALRHFFQAEVSRHTPPGRLTEIDAWKLILRQLRHDRAP